LTVNITVWPGLTTRGTGPPGPCNPEQGAILVSASPLSSSERWSYEERPPAQTSASDWIGTPDGHQREAGQRINAPSERSCVSSRFDGLRV
jgi:hypothetical protein